MGSTPIHSRNEPTIGKLNMITDHNLSELDSIISEFFDIESKTYGGPKQQFIARYFGNIKEKDTDKAFEKIHGALKPHELVPLLRDEGEHLALFIMPEAEKKRSLNPRLNLILFILTLISVLATGGLYGYEGELPGNAWQFIWELIKSGWPFAVSLLAILSAHEFGHYFAGRKNDVQVTLPYFVPFPLSLFGTMGAFINMRSLPKNKRALFDLAVTGPLSGAIVSIVVLFIGLQLSNLNQLPFMASSDSALQMEGNSLLYLLIKFLSFGRLLPKPPDLSGFHLFTYWLRYFFTGQPFPWGAQDVMLHPVAWAGWAGLLVTGLNLVPAGQLDGGHIFYALFGKKAAMRLFPFIIGALVLMSFFWSGWWLWAGLVFFLGRKHAEPMDQVTKLDGKRRWLGYLALVVFILTFVPVPMTLGGV